MMRAKRLRCSSLSTESIHLRREHLVVHGEIVEHGFDFAGFFRGKIEFLFQLDEGLLLGRILR